ncbi:ABC transporter ATP-binding protein [Nocardia sp. N2S4-5]|uniref:ABC transporter ATP-binding protein n=1 Tax=Nocardia sp. N2S4-5 TaxID=3351565 RepID=UPI0037CD3F57
MRTVEAVRAVKISFATAYAADRRHTLALTICALIQINSAVITGILLKTVVGAAVDHRGGLVLTGALLIGANASLLFVLLVIRNRFTRVLTDRTAARYDAETMTLAAEVPEISHYETPEYLDRLAVIRHQPTALAQSFAVLVNGGAIIVQAVVVVSILLSLHPVMVVLPLLALPGFWTMRMGHRIAARSFDDTAESRRVAGRLFESATSLGAAAEIRLSRLGPELIRRHDVSWSTMHEGIQRAEYKAAAIQAAGRLLLLGGYVGAIGLIVANGLNGSASAGDVLLTVVLAGVLNQQIWQVLEVIRRSMYVMMVMERFAWLVDFARSRRDRPAVAAPAPDRLHSGIRLRGITFRYPGTEAEVLRDVDIDLPAGSVVALVGENGAGKSTIVKLLTRMYEPERGTIEIDGIPLRDLDIDEWRARTTAVFQDFGKLEFELGVSVGVGNLPLLGDQAEIASALDRAGADNLAATLDRGLATPLGDSFADGVQLSGGQWQKVALARGMMRRAPLLLLLDEPTASLDPESEYELFARHADLARETARATGGITLLVSHRFSSVRSADLVVVLSGGAVAETGTHEELVTRGGLYTDWYSTQVRAYG